MNDFFFFFLNPVYIRDLESWNKVAVFGELWEHQKFVETNTPSLLFAGNRLLTICPSSWAQLLSGVWNETRILFEQLMLNSSFLNYYRLNPTDFSLPCQVRSVYKKWRWLDVVEDRVGRSIRPAFKSNKIFSVHYQIKSNLLFRKFPILFAGGEIEWERTKTPSHHDQMHAINFRGRHHKAHKNTWI